MQRETQPYLDQLGLNISSRTPLNQLSLAQQQMVEIAKALSLQAKILIMDEPTSSLTTDRDAEFNPRGQRAALAGRLDFVHLAPARSKSLSWPTG